MELLRCIFLDCPTDINKNKSTDQQKKPINNCRFLPSPEYFTLPIHCSFQFFLHSFYLLFFFPFSFCIDKNQTFYLTSETKQQQHWESPKKKRKKKTDSKAIECPTMCLFDYSITKKKKPTY